MKQNLGKTIKDIYHKISCLENKLKNSTSTDLRLYKVYTALLTQTGTNDPIPTILENTLGELNFSYLDVGKYEISSLNLFTNNKTTIFFGNVINNANAQLGNVTCQGEDISDSSIPFVVNGDFVSGALDISNNLLLKTLVEIKVYY